MGATKGHRVIKLVGADSVLCQHSCERSDSHSLGIKIKSESLSLSPSPPCKITSDKFKSHLPTVVHQRRERAEVEDGQRSQQLTQTLHPEGAGILKSQSHRENVGPLCSRSPGSARAQQPRRQEVKDGGSKTSPHHRHHHQGLFGRRHIWYERLLVCVCL